MYQWICDSNGQIGPVVVVVVVVVLEVVLVGVELTGRANLSIEIRKLLSKLIYHLGPSSLWLTSLLSIGLEIKVFVVVRLTLDSVVVVVVGKTPEFGASLASPSVVRLSALEVFETITVVGLLVVVGVNMLATVDVGFPNIRLILGINLLVVGKLKNGISLT